jgi:excisionase family DNA binding protein
VTAQCARHIEEIGAETRWLATRTHNEKIHSTKEENMKDCSTGNTGLEKMAYSMAEAAMMLSLSLRTIENLIANKELLARRVGRRVIVPATSIHAFLRADRYTMARAA